MTSLRAAACVLAVWVGLPPLPAAAAAPQAGATAVPGLPEILERSADARGGLEAWRKIHSMAWSGHVERADGSGPRLPFLFEQGRPNRTRFEIATEGQRSVRVFDGKEGWKSRPGATGRVDVQPYGEEELRAGRDAIVIDGPLLDAAAKGIEVALEGVDAVDGRRAYRLVARLPSGTSQRVWVDAETFLEVKHERPGRDASGRPVTAAIYLRDYQEVEGLRIPFSIETSGNGHADRLVIEKVQLNPLFPDGTFARPTPRRGKRGIAVDTRSASATVPPGSPSTP